MLSIRAISKRYGETRALTAASIPFRPGTIHTILGENGSGKSTLVKILSGIVAPDSGQILLDGQPFSASSPAAFQRAGFATAFQEILIAPDLSVTDNILLGLDGLWTRAIPRNARRDRVMQVLSQIARTPLDPDARAGDQPLAAQQLIVLARAVARAPRILILDEITAALDFNDRETVFAFMRGQAAAGRLILFITHRMDEVMALSDDITVLRGGQVVRTEACGTSTPAELLRAMAPRTAEELADLHHG